MDGKRARAAVSLVQNLRIPLSSSACKTPCSLLTECWSLYKGKEPEKKETKTITEPLLSDPIAKTNYRFNSFQTLLTLDCNGPPTRIPPSHLSRAIRRSHPLAPPSSSSALSLLAEAATAFHFQHKSSAPNHLHPVRPHLVQQRARLMRQKAHNSHLADSSHQRSQSSL